MKPPVSTPDPTRERVEAAARVAEYLAAEDSPADPGTGAVAWCERADGVTVPLWLNDLRSLLATDAALATERTLRAEAEAKVAAVEAVLGEHWDWKAGRSLHEAIRAALRTRPQGEEGSG